MMNPTLSTTALNTTVETDAMMYMSGTSMATPIVSGAAALLFQVNPNLTPSMIKMILQYTAQPLNGANMLEQGAGQMNLEGAIRLAKTYRTDVNFNYSATYGMNLLATGAIFPAATSTLNGQTFSWSQGILADHSYVKGQSLANTFHLVYRNGMWFEKGVSHNILHQYVLNTNFYNPAALTLVAKALTSNGTAMGGGSVYKAFGVLISDGVLIFDGVLIGDGVLVSDGVLVCDGVLVSDTTMANSTLGGDDTPDMEEAPADEEVQ